ncbi:hypothetical protein N7472_003649 [Penicillium cf. griseofulvum]|uniref:Uncharacterized protein n=1 Tax=Penicillium cf. griseofulvum TaxID=2972120 RepID=A0A9W9T2S6_9EURO|nr:hypothetical protein N7472_003649 [Penicillium cf. griseofulvum]
MARVEFLFWDFPRLACKNGRIMIGSESGGWSCYGIISCYQPRGTRAGPPWSVVYTYSYAVRVRCDIWRYEACSRSDWIDAQATETLGLDWQYQ